MTGAAPAAARLAGSPELASTAGAGCRIRSGVGTSNVDGGRKTVEMGAFVPGTGSGGEAGAGRESAVAAAKQELATLRGVLDAIQEALAAAVARLEALETQLAGAAPETRKPSGGSASPPPPAPVRTVAEWKLPGWTPASGDVVTGDTLRARREALGISQASVAHAAHCSRGLVAEVERGKRRSAQTLAHLAAVLDRLEKQARRN